jgi:DNA/RNA-binding domain of Phe-tRNA-synthetase-like protein
MFGSMSLVVIHDHQISAAFPHHVTGTMRISASREILPKPDASAELARIFSADGGDSKARRGAEYWREIYDNIGAKPKYRPSLRNLLDHYEQHRQLRIPVPLVELYCWYSLVHGIPMAGYRVEGINGPLRLTIPGPGHLFTPLGQPRGSQERTKPKEVAYVDDEKVICRYWNYRDCDETKLVAGVTDAVFIFDFVIVPDILDLRTAHKLMDDFAQLVAGAEGGVSRAIIDGREHAQAELA